MKLPLETQNILISSHRDSILCFIDPVIKFIMPKKNKKQKHATRRYLSCVILKSRMLQHFNLVDSSRTSVFT